MKLNLSEYSEEEILDALNESKLSHNILRCTSCFNWVNYSLYELHDENHGEHYLGCDKCTKLCCCGERYDNNL